GKPRARARGEQAGAAAGGAQAPLSARHAVSLPPAHQLPFPRAARGRSLVRRGGAAHGVGGEELLATALSARLSRNARPEARAPHGVSRRGAHGSGRGSDGCAVGARRLSVDAPCELPGHAGARRPAAVLAALPPARPTSAPRPARPATASPARSRRTPDGRSSCARRSARGGSG